MECQTAHGEVVFCSNGYYGFQPLLNGVAGERESHTNGTLGEGGGLAHAASPEAVWQRKRQREDCGNGVECVAGLANGGTAAAKRLCPDIYHAKLQQAVGYTAAAHTVPFEDGTDSLSIGTDSMMMMTDETGEGSLSSFPMENGVETLHQANGRTVLRDVTTLGAAQMVPHTCCTTRAQLCTMSLQQSYILSSSQECPRCLAGEPAPYLNTHQTVENLSKLY